MGNATFGRSIARSGLILALLASAPASAQELDAELLFNQKFQGIFNTNADVDLVQFEEAAGSLLTISATPVGGSKVKPRLELLDQAQSLISTAGFEKQSSKTFTIKKFPMPYSGTYFIRATSGNGGVGFYRISLKGKPVSTVTDSGTVASAAELHEVTFSARAGSKISGTIKQTGGDVEPLLVEVVGPVGAVAIAGGKSSLNSAGTKLSLSGLPLPKLGEYILRFTGASGTTGDYKVKLEIDSPKKVGGSIYEPGHPKDPGFTGPKFSLVDVAFGRGLRSVDGASMQVVSPLSLVVTDPISGLPVPGSLQPLFPSGSLDALISFNLGVLYQPPVVPRNAVLVLKFDDKIDESSLNLMDGKLGPTSPIVVATNGVNVPLEVFVSGKTLILNPVTEGNVGFAASPIVIDGSGNPVASATGDAKLSISSKGQNVLSSTKGGKYSPRSDGLASPDSGGIPLGFNPGNQVLDFFSQSVAGVDPGGFSGFLPDNRAPRLIREFKIEGIFTPNVVAPGSGDQFGPTSFSIIQTTKFNVLAKKGLGEWAGGVLRLRPGTVNQEQANITSCSTMDLGGGMFRNTVQLASPLQAPPAVGEAYEIVRAEYFEPDPLSPIDLTLFDPLNPENVNNTDLLNFATILDPDLVEQDPTMAIDPQSSISFRFSEPMATESFRAYESFYVTDDAPSTNPGINIAGRVTSSDSARVFTFRPERIVQYGVQEGLIQNLGFGNTSKTLRFHIKVIPEASTIEGLVGGPGLAAFIAEGEFGVTDTGGRSLAFPSSQISPSSLVVDYNFAFTIAADASLMNYGAIVHRFKGQAQTGFDSGGNTGVTFRDVPAEICGPNGNVYGPKIAELNLFANGFLAGAPVQFFQKIHDDFNPPPTGQLTAFPNGAGTPLGGFAVLGGSRFMNIYRAVDASPDWEALGGTLLDLINVAWAPAGGSVTNTTIPDLQIHAGHSHIIPDTKQSGGIPSLPQTGLADTGNSNVMGGHQQVLGNLGSPYVKGAYDAVVAGVNTELRRQLVWGSLKPGAQTDFYNGHEYVIDNSNLFVPPGTSRKYHQLPNGDFDEPFPYNNGALDVQVFNASTGFTSVPTWGGLQGARMPQSLIMEYRVRVVDPDDPPANSNSFTFAVGVLSSAMPRFRIYSYGVNCVACCEGTSATAAACKNTCSIWQTAMNGGTGGTPLEPDNVRNAAGPAPAPPGLPCFCLNGTGVAPVALCPDTVVNTAAPTVTAVSGGTANPTNNNFGDNSRYFMVFNYVKRESQIISPFVQVQPTTVTNPFFFAPMFDPPLSDLPVGTSFDVRFRSSTNGLGLGDSTPFVDVEDMAVLANPINQTPNTPFLQFDVRTQGDTSTQLNPAMNEISIPFRTNQ